MKDLTLFSLNLLSLMVPAHIGRANIWRKMVDGFLEEDI
jgi:hypothetical protein